MPFLPGTAGREFEVALCSDTEQRTWSELESSVRRIANGFASLGLGEGDRVAVLAANCVEWVEIMLASVRGGTKVVPVNWHLTAPEVAYMLADSGAKVLVCDAHNAQVGRAAARETRVEQMLVIGEGFSRWCEGQSDAEPVNVRAGGPMFYTSEYYGFSEGAGMTFATSADWLARPGTVGQAPEGIEIQVVGEQGGELAAGEVGTIYFRRPGKPSPYYHNAPDKTAESERPGGWFSVGDVGWLDADGYLFLADRKSDMIISGGVNIYPAEVEAALSEHPAVEDCAVFGVPDEEWGEAVKAAVMLAPGVAVVDEATLIAWCHERIAGFKCPRSIDFHDALPREASGKLMKRKLREPYWQDLGRRI